MTKVSAALYVQIFLWASVLPVWPGSGSGPSPNKHKAVGLGFCWTEKWLELFVPVEHMYQHLFTLRVAVFLALRMVVFISGPLVTSSSMKFPPRNRKNPGRTFFGGNSHPDFASSGCKWAPEGGEIGLLSLGSEARANNRRNGILQQRELIDLSGPEEESRKLRKKWSCKL